MKIISAHGVEFTYIKGMREALRRQTSRGFEQTKKMMNH